MNSPNEFTPAKGGAPVARMSKKPLLFVLIAGLILASVLVYAVNFSKRDKEAKARPPIETQPDKPLAAETAGLGLAVQPPPKEKPEPRHISPDKQIVVVAPQKNERAETMRREHEQLRRQKMQETTNALRAPMGVIKGGGQQNKVQASGAQEVPKERTMTPPGGANRAEALASLAPDAYNPSADKDKEAFFARNADHKWMLSGTRTPGQPCELKTGAVIPGVMITGINSELPGSIIAQVSQNVFDTANGAYLLIPQGSKLFGVYDSRVVYGQSRVLVAWNRIIFPDGSAVTLEAMPGSDMAGYAGFNDDVDNHYVRIFGSAVLMSLISGGLAYTMDSMSSTAGPYGQNAPSLQNEMTSALGSQLGQTATKLLEKNLNIKPTLGIRPGYQFNVIVTKDMVFEAPYAAWR